MFELKSLSALTMLMAVRVGKRREEREKGKFRFLADFDTTGTNRLTGLDEKKAEDDLAELDHSMGPVLFQFVAML